MGSGTTISLDGKLYVLTAAHVVEDAMSGTVSRRIDKDGQEVITEDKTPRKVEVRSRIGKVQALRKAAIVLYDAKDDLALLRPEDERGLVAGLVAPSGTEVEEGEDAWYCGSGGGLFKSLVKTVVNQKDDDWLVVNGAGWYGHSGSGAFVKRDGKHVLVGVVVVLMNGQNPKSPIGCVTLEKIHKFLKAHKEK